ncbi:MAG TPA: hypothetical protein VE865_13980 [Bradyrhizobium sp.]|nr:hypothetical protein [Bradyrhizobium sp.]
MSGSAYYDVLVAGAGVAGCLVAGRLSASGRRVLLLHEQRPQRPRLGEFLSARARIAIDRLRVMAPGWEAAYAEAGEFVSCWGSSDPVVRNFLFDPFGQSLILDRGHFDQALLTAARQNGCELVDTIPPLGVTRSDGGWNVAFNDSGRTRAVTSPFLILCGGRTARRIAALHTKRHRVDKLVCFGMRVSNYQGDRRPAVETYDNGWAYSVGLPGGELMINLFTESNPQSNRRISGSPDFLLREIASCPITRSRALLSNPGDRADVETFVADASSAQCRPVTGPGWCLAGDQAQSMDPLSSSGILQAARHAQSITDSILDAASIESIDLTRYVADLDMSYDSFLSTRHDVYGIERRWSSPFWSRRSRAGSTGEPTHDVRADRGSLSR